MNLYPLIFIIIHFRCLVKVISKEALIFNIDTEQLDDLKYRSNASLWNCLLACPASTTQQKLIDEKISISGKSVFLKEIHRYVEYERKIKTNICTDPIKPVTVHHPKLNEYSIGYELYYDDTKILLKSKNYHDRFELANNESEAINPKHLVTSSILKYQDGKDMRVFFSDRTTSLVFYWINVLTIKLLPEQHKMVSFGTVELKNVQGLPLETCENYNPEYTKMNFMHQNNSLKNVLGKWQITPVWYFIPDSAKIAACTYANSIPVWEDFVDKQLEKVDRYIYTVVRYFKMKVPNADVKLDFGVFGDAKMRISGSSQLLNVCLSDTEQCQATAIPNIIYRVIKCKITTHNYWHIQSAAVIIHNDRIPVPDIDRLCSKENELRGWDKIKNKIGTAGLTYVCPITKDIDDKLGPFGIIPRGELFDLNLDKIPSPGTNISGLESFTNIADGINNEFKKLYSIY